MTDCRRTFDESLLSGYLDRALGQSDEQKVRLHLEDCEACRALVAEMEELRDMTLSSRFEVPPDDQWDESPRGAFSRWFRGVGWLLLAVWVAATLSFTASEIWSEASGWGERLLLFGGASALGLLFLSALVDRWSTYRIDRYREIRK